MTPETTITGYALVVGALLILVGHAVVRILAKRELETEQRRVHPSFGNRPEQLEQQESAAAPFGHDMALAKHTADGIARIEMAFEAALLADPRSVLWSVPQQRRPFDVESEGL